jgi:hypothetical protein
MPIASRMPGTTLVCSMASRLPAVGT